MRRTKSLVIQSCARDLIEAMTPTTPNSRDSPSTGVHLGRELAVSNSSSGKAEAAMEVVLNSNSREEDFSSLVVLDFHENVWRNRLVALRYGV